MNALQQTEIVVTPYRALELAEKSMQDTLRIIQNHELMSPAFRQEFQMAIAIISKMKTEHQSYAH